MLASLIFATEGGFDFGSEGHDAVQKRMRDLASMQGSAASAAGDDAGQQGGGATARKEEMANEFNLGIADLMSVFALEGKIGEHRRRCARAHKRTPRAD